MYDQELMPPIQLVAANGVGMTQKDEEKGREEFHRIGHGLIREMQRSGYIKPTDDVLDVGCGLGRLARALVGKFTTGSYIGMDVVKSSIDWCKDAYAGIPNFRFEHADAYNTHYNTTATVKASDYVFPFKDESFDFIWSTSLFTHTFIETLDNYLGQMSRVMRPGATTWNSYCLLDAVSEPLAAHYGPKGIRFKVDGGLVAREEDPEHLIALYTDRVLALHEKNGLEVVEVRNGRWSGRTDNIKTSFQDVFLARKPL